MVESIAVLRTICEKDSRKDRPISEVIPREIAIYITWLFLHTKISANQVTLLGFCLGASAGVLFIFGHEWFMVFGSILLLANFQLDYVDGEIARYRRTASLTGRYISTLFGHHILECWIFICLSFGVYNALHDVKAFIFGFSAAMSVLMIRLAVFNSYAGVVETALHLSRKTERSRDPEEHHEGSAVNIHGTEASNAGDYVKSYVSSLGSLVYYIFENLLSPGRELMLLVAAVADVIILNTLSSTPNFRVIYWVLMFWGVITLIAWIWLATVTIKKKTSETLFAQLFGQPGSGPSERKGAE